MLYMYLMSNEQPLNRELVESHVAYLRKLKAEERLVLCGPFTDYPGGMVVISAESAEAAVLTAEADPFIAAGCKTYELRSFEPATEDNNYLLG